jgi:hypothetical protein
MRFKYQSDRSVAQLEEQRSPKPQAGGSNPPTPAIIKYLAEVVEW